MSLQKFLTNPDIPLVIDASVAINMIATGFADRILSVLPNPILITDIAANELKDDTGKNYNDESSLNKLLEANNIKLVKLGSKGQEYFENLVVGPTVDTLDDGESATIAYALEMGCIAVIDEKKASSLCARKHPDLPIVSTMDLLSHSHVNDNLGDHSLSQALLNALLKARMTVNPQYHDWVVRIVGVDKIKLCISLPLSVREQTAMKID